MKNSLHHHDPAKPAMHKVENVKRNSKQPDQRVVSASQNDKRNHVNHRKSASSISQMMQHRGLFPMPLDAVCAKNDVHGNDASQRKTLEAGWKDAKAHRSYTHFPAMTLSKQWCVEKMLLEICIQLVGVLEVSLRIIVEASQCANISNRM